MGSYPEIGEAARKLFRNAVQYRLEYGARAVSARLRTLSEDEWKHIAHGGEGLWRKLRRACMTECDPNALCAATVSKRYPLTRAARLLLCAYLGVTEEDLRRPLAYARVLAANAQGKALLRESKKQGDLPLYNLGQRPCDLDAWELEQRCGDLYALFAEPGAEIKIGGEKKLRTILIN